MSVYISYCDQDYAFVKGLIELLENKGVVVVTHGFEEDNSMAMKNSLEAIEHSSIVVFFSTIHSNYSRINVKEMLAALGMEKEIVSLVLDGSHFNKQLNDLNNHCIIDGTSLDDNKIIEKLLQRIKMVTGRSSSVRFSIGGERCDTDYRQAEQMPDVSLRRIADERLRLEEERKKVEEERIWLEEARKRLEEERMWLEEKRKRTEEEQRRWIGIDDEHECDIRYSIIGPEKTNSVEEDSPISLREKIKMRSSPNIIKTIETYEPRVDVGDGSKHLNIFRRFFNNRRRNLGEEKRVYSSVFAPAEIERETHMIVQVFLHLPEETLEVKEYAQEAQKDAERRDYVPLSCMLKIGDKVDVELSISDSKVLKTEKKAIVWQGFFSKCSFDFYVSKQVSHTGITSVVTLMKEGVPVGEMMFTTLIVDESPKTVNPKVVSRTFNKIFISYAHQDEDRVKYIAEAYRAEGTDYFFDRHYLKTGDVFPKKIQDYINEADLFILCWSENAVHSDYVQKERSQALKLASTSNEKEVAKLRIYPLSIEPRAELPLDMKDNYNFGML